MELKKREPGKRGSLPKFGVVEENYIKESNGLSKEGGLTKVELTKKIGAALEGKIREALSRRGA